MQWTPEQQWAVSVDRHAIVTASAGSGKTAVLVRRYVELVLSGVDPRAIVAITFTRKAAAEMYARIAAEIDRQIAEATAPQEIARLKPLRECLTGAPISTIHSFCAQLLRRFPIEAGILPNFTELTEPEAERLAQEVAIQVLEELLMEGRSSEIWRFVREYGRRQTLAFVALALRNIERWVFIRPALGRSVEERVQQARSTFWELFRRTVRRIVDGLLQCAELLQSSDRGRSGNQKAEISELCLRLSSLVSAEDRGEESVMYELWRQLRELAFRKDGQPRSCLEIAEPEFTRLARAVVQMDAITSAWQDRCADEQMFHWIDTLDRIVVAVQDQLEQEKRSRNVLDFN
ncbi:MAG: UvrD-helicase domain-containing protein [Bacteroidota bacterium]|nr:UvrD-helicase domain-containing protein [Bacteroidota bacterium]